MSGNGSAREAVTIEDSLDHDPYPVLEAVSLRPVPGNGFLRRRSLAEIPVPPPGAVRLFQRGETYEAAPADGLRLGSDLIVEATSVVNVSIRNSVRAVTALLPAAVPDRAVRIEATFVCRVIDPQLVLESGCWDVDPILSNWLGEDPKIRIIAGRYDLPHGPATAQKIMARIFARAQLGSMLVPGMDIKISEVCLGLQELAGELVRFSDGGEVPSDRTIEQVEPDPSRVVSEEFASDSLPRRRRGLGMYLRWIAAADESVLDEAPGGRPYFSNMGAILLLTAMMEAAALALATTTAGFGWPSLVFAPIWGATILFLNRMVLLSGLQASRLRYVIRLIPRFVLSLFLGLVVSEVLLLSIFAPEIHVRMGEARPVPFLERIQVLDKLVEENAPLQVAKLAFWILILTVDMLPNLLVVLRPKPYAQIVEARNRFQMRTARLRLAAQATRAMSPMSPDRPQKVVEADRAPVAFTGSVLVDSPEPDFPVVVRDAQGFWVLSSGEPQSLRITVSTGDERPPGTGIVRPLLVNDGRPANDVVVEVEVDAPSLAVSADRMSFTLPTSGGTAAETITIRASRPGTYDVRVSAYSSGRIIQALPLAISVSEGPAIDAR